MLRLLVVGEERQQLRQAGKPRFALLLLLLVLPKFFPCLSLLPLPPSSLPSPPSSSTGIMYPSFDGRHTLFCSGMESQNSQLLCVCLGRVLDWLVKRNEQG